LCCVRLGGEQVNANCILAFCMQKYCIIIHVWITLIYDYINFDNVMCTILWTSEYKMGMKHCVLCSCLFLPACPTLMAPENGMIDCSLGDDGIPSVGDTCTVTCNDGFVLDGDATRTCQMNRRRTRWSGTEASCVSGMHERCK